MNERSKIGENAKSWDKIILGISAIIYLLNVVLAGLDSDVFNGLQPLIGVFMQRE